MTRQIATQTQQKTPTTNTLSRGSILQRKCESCGQHTIAGGECTDCAKKGSVLQRKLAIGASNDPLEREADRIADQVMASSEHPGVSDAPPHIQRFMGQTGQADMAAPASVDRVLSSPGRPLEPSLQQDMEQRFGHDFSRVRVHTDASAERSARDVNANAYTVGHNIVFGAGRFVPQTYQGRRLLTHELTHVMQQCSGNAEVASSPARIQRQEAAAPPVVNPEIANVPVNRFVDAYTSVHYSLDYRAVGENLSTWLQVLYSDGTTIDISTYDIRENESVDSSAHLRMMAQGRLGDGGRIFPQVMNGTTTPRLAAAKRSAIETMEEYNYEFMLAAFPAVFFIITAAVGGIGRPVAPRRTVVRLPTVRRTPPPVAGSTPPTTPTTAPLRPTTAPLQPVATAATRAAAAVGGGFSRGGITVEEIVVINRRFGGTNTITGHPSSAIAAAERQTGFWKKVAAIVREIAGRHMFDDGNKRTAEEIVRILVERNGVTTGVTGAELRRVLLQVATGALREVDEIAQALRGF